MLSTTEETRTARSSAETDRILALIDTWLAERPAGLMRRSAVVDHLLDLRSEVEDDPELVAEVDQLLRDVPGHTVVESTWWLPLARQLRDRFAPFDAGVDVDVAPSEN